MNVTIRTRHGDITMNAEPAALNLLTSWLYAASHVERDRETNTYVLSADHANEEIRDCANTIFHANYDNGYYKREFNGKDQK